MDDGEYLYSMKYMVVCILYIKRSDGIVSFLNYSIYKMA